jgi:hypothetical protein
LSKSLATATNQHRQAAIFIGRGGNPTDREKYADGDVTISDQIVDVRQYHRNLCGVRHHELFV